MQFSSDSLSRHTDILDNTSSQESSPSSFFPSLNDTASVVTSPKGHQKRLPETRIEHPEGLLDLAVFGIESRFSEKPNGSCLSETVIHFEGSTLSEKGPGMLPLDRKTEGLLDLSPFGIMTGVLGGRPEVSRTTDMMNSVGDYGSGAESVREGGKLRSNFELSTRAGVTVNVVESRRDEPVNNSLRQERNPGRRLSSGCSAAF